MTPSSLAFIPSPKNGILRIGPLPLHAYGLMLALGILAAATIAQKRWKDARRDPAILRSLVVPVVIGGIVGARIYHLFTGYSWRDLGVVGTVEIWRGGLSIWGALGGGLVVLAFVARRRHLELLVLLDAIAPAVAVGQAIGRWGNYFNQELFGRPTTLPWALEIDRAHRPIGYAQFHTFHPTFLYESLWCLLVFAGITWVERHFRLRRGQAFFMYLALYTFGRTGFEALRIDDATRIFGARFNLLLSASLFVIATVWFVRLGRSARRDRARHSVSPSGRDRPHRAATSRE